MTNIEVPEGRLHYDELIVRGWTPAMIWALTDVVKVDVPAGMSNRTFLRTEVEQVEVSDPVVRRAVSDAVSRVPRSGGPYDASNTISRVALIKRGWTPRHLQRLLGEPDYVIGNGSDRAAHAFGSDRVATAEATDAKLQARLRQVAAKAETERAATEARSRAAREAREAEMRAVREESMAVTIQAGEAVWRRVGGERVVEGSRLEVGTEVVVRRRNGETQRVHVTHVMHREGAVTLARVTSRRAPAAVARDRQILTTGHLRAGAVVSWRGEWLTVLTTRSVRITSDDPAIWGSHLLGHEEDRGTLCTVRPATEDEAAPLMAAAAAAAEQERRWRAECAGE